MGGAGGNGAGLSSMWQTLACGAASGAFADTVTHPLSTIKTRLQVQGAGMATASAREAGNMQVYTSTRHALARILATEGPAALYTGLGAVLLGAAPATGLYFIGYEAIKSLGPSNSMVHFAAGNIAQLCGSLAWVPMDVVKERLQVEGQLKTSKSYGGTVEAVRGIVRFEGLRGLYRAYWMHQATWAPFNGIYQLVYEQAKRAFDAEGSTPRTVASTLVAGSVAAATTAPIDLVKTRLQVAKSNPEVFNYTGAVDAFRKIAKHEGIPALFDGVAARVVWLTPRMGCAMTAYEFFKRRIVASNEREALSS